MREAGVIGGGSAMTGTHGTGTQGVCVCVGGWPRRTSCMHACVTAALTLGRFSLAEGGAGKGRANVTTLAERT